ncbi:MAG: hypothetical protein H0U67_10585 [Gemmatimonadetes bacterium]|nr:hypothetical protein [Gemmatimonadota bacterium]
MKLFRSIAALLRGGAPGFSVLESELLVEAQRRLDAGRADQLKRRVESVNLVQRLDGGREVNAYSIKNGKPAFDESLRLLGENDERELAKFSFRTSDGRHYKGSIWLVNGQLFSLEFDNITEHILDCHPLDLDLSICI